MECFAISNKKWRVSPLSNVQDPAGRQCPAGSSVCQKPQKHLEIRYNRENARCGNGRTKKRRTAGASDCGAGGAGAGGSSAAEARKGQGAGQKSCKGTVEKTVSTTDPDCGVLVNGEHARQFAYEAHTVCGKSGFALIFAYFCPNYEGTPAFAS